MFDMNALPELLLKGLHFLGVGELEDLGTVLIDDLDAAFELDFDLALFVLPDGIGEKLHEGIGRRELLPHHPDDDRFDLDNEGLTMAVVSYDDHLFFGVKSDRDVLPELDQLASGIDREFRSLLDAAGVLEQKG